MQCLQDLRVAFLIIHLEKGKQLAAACDHRKQTTTCGIVLLMLLQMLRNVVDLLRKDTDLNLRRAGVLGMRLKLADDLLFIGFLESHKSGGENEDKKNCSRASEKA